MSQLTESSSRDGTTTSCFRRVCGSDGRCRAGVDGHVAAQSGIAPGRALFVVPRRVCGASSEVDDRRVQTCRRFGSAALSACCVNGGRLIEQLHPARSRCQCCRCRYRITWVKATHCQRVLALVPMLVAVRSVIPRYAPEGTSAGGRTGRSTAVKSRSLYRSIRPRLDALSPEFALLLTLQRHSCPELNPSARLR